MEKYLKPILNNIPEELTKLNQWVNWKVQVRDGKETKPPYKPQGGYAKSDDPTTWATFDAVKKALDRFDGIGFELTKDDPFIGIDFDKCYDPNTGDIDPAIEKHIKALNTYTEKSPSGKGLRLLLRGNLPVDGKKNGRVEVYQNRRYVTITGHRLNGYPASIEARQAELDMFYKSAFPGRPEDPKQTPANVAHGRQIICEDWQDRLHKAFSAKNGDKIKLLYDGDTSGYASDDSAADMALCAHLAFWFSSDPAAMDQAFRQSGLMRPKWDRKTGDTTYGQMTIDKAIQGCKEVYQEPVKSYPETTFKENEPEKKTQSQNKKTRGAKGLTLDSVDKCFSQDVSYLYKTHIPHAMPIIVAGREGIGKTSIVVGIVGEILREHQEGYIVWIASEGFLQDTTDKMQKFGTDRSRLIILQHENETFQFGFDRIADRALLDNFLSDCRSSGKVVLAVVIDSIRGISKYGDNESEIKNVMIPLNGIVCDKYRAALIYIDHEKKGQTTNLLDKVSGSPAKTAAVRRVFSIVSVSAYVRKVVLAKSNILGTPPPDLMAALSQGGLTIYEVKDSSDVSLIGQAEQWLIKMFSERGTYKANELYDRGLKAGFTSDVLKKAKTHLNINVWKDAGPGGAWHWSCDTFLNPDSLVLKT